MKALKILLIFEILLGIIYYQIDKRLFYFGKNELNVYDLLPFRIVPDYRPAFEGGFALRDKDGFTIAANGNSYPVNNKPIVIKKVLKYGFAKENLVAVVADAHQISYCLKFNQNQKDKSEISAIMDIDFKADNLNSYKWVNIEGNNDYINKLMLYRTLLTIVIIFLAAILGYILIKFRRHKKNKTSL